MGRFLHRRMIAPLTAPLRQGVTPDALALSVALAIVIGLIPVLGVSTALCALVAMTLRLNLAAMQAVNYLLTPLQLLLILPQLRLGETLVGAAPFPVTLESGLAMLASGVMPAVRALSTAIFHASLVWLLLAPPLAYLLHRVLRAIFARALGRSSSPHVEVTP
jgi:uncharacterized protein (DUF2062 family)